MKEEGEFADGETTSLDDELGDSRGRSQRGKDGGRDLGNHERVWTGGEGEVESIFYFEKVARRRWQLQRDPEAPRGVVFLQRGGESYQGVEFLQNREKEGPT
jgi:hypothetical protein